MPLHATEINLPGDSALIDALHDKLVEYGNRVKNILDKFPGIAPTDRKILDARYKFSILAQVLRNGAVAKYEALEKICETDGDVQLEVFDNAYRAIFNYTKVSDPTHTGKNSQGTGLNYAPLKTE